MFRITFFFILVNSAQSLKLNSIHQDKAKTDANAANLKALSCISDYSKDLNTIKSGLGEHILERARTFGFNKIPDRNDEGALKRVFGVGMGTTATRSLSSALKMMGMHGSHFGPREANIAKSIGVVFTNYERKMQADSPKCYKHLEALYPMGYHVPQGSYAMDTPVGELFLDEFFSFPGALFVLTKRNSTKWVKARYGHSGHELAALQEPCGHYMRSFTHEQNAALLDAHHNLVRCVVPKERLFEINVFEDPPEQMRQLPMALSRFVGRKDIHKFPKRSFIKMTKMGESDTLCDSQKDVMKLYRKMETTSRAAALKNVEKESEADGSDMFTFHISMEGEDEELALTSERFGMLIQYAAQHECEVSIPDAEQ